MERNWKNWQNEHKPEFKPYKRGDADQRCFELIKTLKNTIDLAGFDLIGRIEVRDRKTGRNYR